MPVEDWGSEPVQEETSKRTDAYLKKEVVVSPRDLFTLARGILIGLGVIYLTFGLCRVWIQEDQYSGVKDVWEYTKVILNSTASLVLGFYFGNKTRES